MNYKRIKSLVLSIMLIPFVANTDYCIDSYVLILFNVFIAIQANFKTNTRTNKSWIFESTYNIYLDVTVLKNVLRLCINPQKLF